MVYCGNKPLKFKAVWTIKDLEDLFNSSDKTLISSRIQFLIYSAVFQHEWSFASLASLTHVCMIDECNTIRKQCDDSLKGGKGARWKI